MIESANAVHRETAQLNGKSVCPFLIRIDCNSLGPHGATALVATPLYIGLSRVLRIASALAMILALVGLLLLAVGFVLVFVVIGASDGFLFASTLFSVLAVLTGLAVLAGFVCILTFVTRQVKNPHRFQLKGLQGLAIAFAACIPQFWFGAMFYGFGGTGLLFRLCMFGGGLSVILLIVTQVLIRIAR